jgi:hypothetical protein
VPGVAAAVDRTLMLSSATDAETAYKFLNLLDRGAEHHLVPV